MADEQILALLTQLGDKIDAQGIQLNDKIDAQGAQLNAKIDAQGAQLNAKIDAQGAQLNAKIDALGAQLDAKIDAQGARLNARIDGVAEEQEAMHTEFRGQFERVRSRLDNLHSLALRGATRADDALSAQARMQTELRAIREHLESGDRQLVREFQEDIENLRDRVERIEAKKQ